MEQELDLSVRVVIPEAKEPADRKKISICIASDLCEFYQTNNKGYILTKVLRDVLEQSLREIRARKETSPLLSVKADKIKPPPLQEGV